MAMEWCERLDERDFMNLSDYRKKNITLTFRGFALTAQEVATMVGVAPSMLGNIGEPVRPGVRTMLIRSYVLYEMNFANDYALCDMLPSFIKYLGGIDHICWVQSQVNPEFSELHFDLPVKSDIESQEGYLSAIDVEMICKIRGSISLGFF
jgi:hypothetical protein